MMSCDIWVQSLKEIPAAVETMEALGRIASYPWYIHKWRQKSLQYCENDLSLPNSLNVFGHWPRKLCTIAVGGTRSPAVETFCAATALVREIVKCDALIVSGAVPGVDLAAHLAAAEYSDGATLGVLANPAGAGLGGHEWSSATVEREMLRRGGFVSEYREWCDLWSDIYLERLLARDRIITGISDAFLVFECNVNSATVDTARRAIAQGKPVYCFECGGPSNRKGVYQLVEEFRLPLIDTRRASLEEVAQQIVKASGRMA